jgi:predicted N-acetyltransferase YhbS
MSTPVIRPLLESDLNAADRVHRFAFGTRFGLPDPSKFRGDAQIVRARWATEPDANIVAESDGTIIGGACAMNWGSVFIVGPVYVHPDQAGRGLARLLVREMIARADRTGARLAGLFTFPESATHLRLYESFDFVPQALTPILSKAPEARAQRAHLLFSKLAPVEQEDTIRQLRLMTDLIFPGLDLTREVRAVARLGLGETILLGEPNDVRGFAICHFGPRGEGGDTFFIKFAAVRANAASDFGDVLDACEGFAVGVHAPRIAAGTNTARTGAYRILRERGFRAGLVGVAMHRPDGPGYNRPDVFVIDDWR